MKTAIPANPFITLWSLVMGMAFALVPSATAQTVLKLTLHDTIQPISAAYLDRGLRQAAADHASLVLISLDTPGGLLDSTRQMVASIERSPVPVAIFISPTGARAGSAGFFLLESADIAAMAPGTNAGAAHPIVEGTTMDPILKQKIENDAAAFLRSYTLPRGRNAEAAEDAVRNSKSYSAPEALQLRLIDLVTPTDATLIAALDNRLLRRFDGTQTTLHLSHPTIVALPPSLRERILTRLTDPNLAVLLFLAGILLVYLEFNVPGTIIPGSLGALCLLLALFGFGMLPLRHASILLLLAAVLLWLLEIKIPSHGILGLAGVVCLVVGLATLVNGPIAEMRVHWTVAAAAGTGFGAITLLLAWLAMRARRNKFTLGAAAMLGRLAIVRTPLAPSGQVEVRGELWQATVRNATGPLEPGTEVLVRQIEGLTLIVEAAAASLTTPTPRRVD